jgi:hypothetical protein
MFPPIVGLVLVADISQNLEEFALIPSTSPGRDEGS